MLCTAQLLGKSSLCLVFWIVIFCNSIAAQTYVVTRYADDSGLPSRIVRDVIQDANGFIWVAGNNGLYRFDGQEFKPFLSSLKDTVGLRDNKITSLYEDNGGKLWIGTPKGLHVLEDDKISHFPLKNNPLERQEYILNIFGDNEQNIWVSTYGGIFLLDGSNEPIHLLSDNNEKAIAKETVWSITQDIQGSIWAATNDGFFVRNNENPFSFTKVSLEYDASITETDIGYYKIQQYNDSLFILDTSHGLLKGTVEKNTLTISYFENEGGEFEKGYSIERSIIDKEGNIWLACWKQSLKKFKIDEGLLVEEKVHSKNGFLGIADITHSVFQDFQGNIWLSNTNGLYKLSQDVSNVLTFPPHDCLLDFLGIYSIDEDQGENLWITTPSKLYRFKKEDILNNRCPTEFLELSEKGMEQVRDVFIDSENRLWLGADGGLFITQLDSNQNPGPFARYAKSEGLPHNRSFDILQKDKNEFWVGNYHGLLHLKLNDYKLEIDSVKVFVANTEDPNSLVNSQAINLELDKNNNLWVGTFSGVSRLVDAKSEGTFENYTTTYSDATALSNNSIKKIFKDDNTRIWIATQRGLNLYQPETNSFLQFGHAEGLPSEYVLGIAQDSNGHFFIGTTNGVLRATYDEVSQSFVDAVHYTSNDGLVDNIPYRNSIHIDEDDNVFIGSRDGISIIPKGISTTWSERENLLALTDIQATKKKEIGFASVRKQLKNNSLLLKHNSNSIKIQYALLDYINPENNTYRHKLLPVNDSWVETDRLAELTYYNLPPDEYTIILDAANNRGQWSDSPIELNITIEPPFWKTNWSILFYIVVTTIALWSLYKIRVGKKIKKLEQKAALETAIVNQREQLRKENTADFHDELGSMLTKISMFLTMAERSLESSEDPRPFFHKIRENTKGLSSGFRDLLWVIDPQKDSLADTFLRLKAFGEDLFEQSSIDFTTSEFQEVFTERMLSPKTKKQLVMIFKEAMNNCLKYADANQANLSLSLDGKFSKMEFIDNGRGFDVDKKSKGRGLKNMTNRAKSLDANLTILSSSKGTAIVLDRIPHMGDEFSDKET